MLGGRSTCSKVPPGAKRGSLLAVVEIGQSCRRAAKRGLRTGSDRLALGPED
jgi:hypothetical protein